MVRWNEGRKISRPIGRKNRHGDFVKIATWKHLVYDVDFLFKQKPQWNSLWQHLEQKYRSFKKHGILKNRRTFFDWYILYNIKFFTDKIFEEVILRDGIFCFPGKRAFIFAAQVRESSKYFRYDIGKRSGQVYIYFIMNIRFVRIRWETSARLIIPSKKWLDLLDSEIRKGHKYQTFDYILSQIIDDGKRSANLSGQQQSVSVPADSDG